MLIRRRVPDETDPVARRVRYRFYLVGSAVAAAGITMGTMPLFAQATPVLVAKGCALTGAAILAVGRFSSTGFLRRLVRTRN
jgi:hypothetical protein